MPDDDDRDDTTTAQAPVPGRLPESEEEVPTKVTSFSAAEIAKIDAEYEAQRKKAADQIDTASLVLPVVPTPSKPPSAKLPAARPLPNPAPLPAPVPHAPPIRPAAGSPANISASASALPASEPSESDEEDDSIVTIQVRPEDPADDSIVTVQKPVQAPPSQPQLQKAPPSSPSPIAHPAQASPIPPPAKPPTSVRIPVMPATQQSPLAPTIPVIPKISPPAPTPPPRKKPEDDVYDAEEDRTERRDLPFEEIERAVARAKLDSVSITEFPDDSPTARRRVPGPYSHLPVETIASPTIKSARESSTNEVDTTTDVSPTAKRVAKDVLGDAMPRMPQASDSDVIATERRQRENIDPHTLAETPAPAIERAPNSPRPAPVTTPLPLQSNKPTMRFGATMPIPQTNAAAQNTPLRGSDPSIAMPPPESSPRLQAVIPLVLPSSGNIPVATAVGSIPPGSSGQSHNMPSSGMHASAPPASMGGINATMPSAQMQGTPGPPQASRSTGSLQPPSMQQSPSIQPASMQQQPSLQPPGFPATYTGSGRIDVPAQSQSEPRWIVLVLVVLAICMLIPALLYVALRPREESDLGTQAPSAVPVIPVRPPTTSKPVDIGQAPKRR